MSQLILGSSIKMELASKVDYISLIFGIENVYLPLFSMGWYLLFGTLEQVDS